MPVVHYRDPDQEDAGSLEGWWDIISRGDLQDLMPKVEEYEALDLEIMGDVLRKMIEHGSMHKSDLRPAELGVFFYALGKVARWASAIAAGKEASADTIKDLAIYATMARRIRQAGTWPGPLRQDQEDC